MLGFGVFLFKVLWLSAIGNVDPCWTHWEAPAALILDRDVQLGRYRLILVSAGLERRPIRSFAHLMRTISTLRLAPALAGNPARGLSGP